MALLLLPPIIVYCVFKRSALSVSEWCPAYAGARLVLVHLRWSDVIGIMMFYPRIDALFLLYLQLTLTPTQQQLLLQQAQAQLLAAAVQHSASQQHSAAGATISASAATPVTQIPFPQPLQIAPVSMPHVSRIYFSCLMRKLHKIHLIVKFFYSQDLQQLQQLQQQNLNLQQFVLVHPTTNLPPAQFIISQTPQGQQGDRLLADPVDPWYPEDEAYRRI